MTKRHGTYGPLSDWDPNSRAYKKAARRDAAMVRQEARQKRTPQEQLARLDRRNATARQERARLEAAA